MGQQENKNQTGSATRRLITRLISTSSMDRPSKACRLRCIRKIATCIQKHKGSETLQHQIQVMHKISTLLKAGTLNMKYMISFIHIGIKKMT
jgi:hypothetical protein